LPDQLTDQLIQEVRDYARREIRSGYSDRRDAIEFVSAVFSSDCDEDRLRPLATVWVDQALADYEREVATWPDVTDCDRLDAAFASLEQAGIVARQNFSCCGTCGAAEIWDEIPVEDAKSGAARGYAFFHQQDTERAVDGDGLYLNYGACAEGEAAAVAIGHEIVAHFEKAGLTTKWNGTYQRRIDVTLDWKRRRPNSD
jgi:hypothetical protein